MTTDCKCEHAKRASQRQQIFDIMSSGKWYTLREIGRYANCETQTASARIRDLRKDKFGAHTIERRRCMADWNIGVVYEYRMIERVGK